MARVFEDKPATREPVPLLVGLAGPSGGGKTFSALRIATGMQRVTGGEIFVIDTEARRSLHYAERFKFRHVPFTAPFGPLDYLAAIEHCARQGARNIVVDSASHEHEGRGGVLEMHDAEARRLAAEWKVSLDTAKMSAWNKPKAERRRFIDGVLHTPNCNFIFCFRAKPKLKIVKGEKPEPRGFMPIAGEEFVFEMMINCLLYPNAGGVPTWQSEEEGERMMIKLPEQFRGLLLNHRGPLDEEIGTRLAEWAAGTEAPPRMTLDQLLNAYEACPDGDTYDELEKSRKLLWGGLKKEHKGLLKNAADAAAKRLLDASKAAATADEPRQREPGED